MESQAYENIKNINSIKGAHIETFLNSEKEVVSALASSSVFRQFLKTPISSSDYQNQKDFLRHFHDEFHMYKEYNLLIPRMIIMTTFARVKEQKEALN